MKCDIFNGHNIYSFYKIDLRNFFKCLERHYPIAYESLSVAFLPEKAICDLHRRFLNDDSPTDVITFSLMERDSTAEICISVDQAIKVSSELKCNMIDEIKLYLVHGWLHLFGYDDKTPAQCLKMRRAEQEALSYIQKSQLILRYHRLQS